jgi:hypothetical protein
MVLEVLEGKMVFSEGSRCICGFFEWRERTRALAKTGKFSGIFGEFLEWLGPNHKYFSEAEGPAAIRPTRRDHSAIYNKLRGLNAKW